MKNLFKIIAILLATASSGLMAEDQLYFTYGFESGNSLIGQYYGQQEYRHFLRSVLDKKMENYKLSTDLTLYYSSLDKYTLRTARVGFEQIALGNGLMNVYLGDNGINLPYNSGMSYGRVRGITSEYRLKWLTAGIFFGTPSELYRRNSSINEKNTIGSYVGVKPLDWLSEKIYIFRESNTLATDTLFRRATGIGQQLDITFPWGVNMMLSTTWKRRQEVIAGNTVTKAAPSVSSNVTWATKKISVSGGMDFLGANFRPLQSKNYWGPRLYARWQPNDIFGVDARISNYNADGDTLFPTITNNWGAGTSMRLPNLPSVKVNYSNTDNKVDWGGPTSRWYASDDKSIEFSQAFNRFEMGLKYQVNNRTEKNLQSMDAVRDAWKIKPLYRTQLATFWLSGEFDSWKDTKQNSSGFYKRYRAGSNVGLWNGSRAITEIGFDDRNDYYSHSGSWTANLQLKFNLSKKYLVDFSWWNQNNIAQDTGFFYQRDRSRLGLSITRRFDVSGNDMEGMVFLDANKNGIQDAGEFGLPGIMLSLSDGKRAITDAKGKYSFNNISSKNPVVKIDMSTLSAEYNLIGAGERPASLGGWRSTLVNFAVSSLGGLKGRIFVDNNLNGQFDDDDYGLSGVTVVLQPANVASVSNGGGIFRITNVPTGPQTLMVDPNSIPPDYQLKSEERKVINIRQGEMINHLEFPVVKKIRPVRKVIFGGVSTIEIDANTNYTKQSKAATAQDPRQAEKQDRVTISAKQSVARMSQAELRRCTKKVPICMSRVIPGGLKIWQRILRSDPNHNDARRNLEKTEQKLDALKRVKGQ